MAFLKHIQRKSSTVKAQYAFGAATVVTGLIGVIWVSTLPAKFSTISVATPSVEGTDELNGFLTNTKDQLGSIVEAVNETGETRDKQPTTNLDMLGVAEVPENTVTATTIIPDQLAPPQTIESTTTPAVSPKSTEPTFILIGTSTSQKTNTTP